MNEVLNDFFLMVCWVLLAFIISTFVVNVVEDMKNNLPADCGDDCACWHEKTLSAPNIHNANYRAQMEQNCLLRVKK